MRYEYERQADACFISQHLFLSYLAMSYEKQGFLSRKPLTSMAFSSAAPPQNAARRLMICGSRGRTRDLASGGRESPEFVGWWWMAGSEQSDDPESLVPGPSRWSDPATQPRKVAITLRVMSLGHSGNERLENVRTRHTQSSSRGSVVATLPWFSVPSQPFGNNGTRR